MFSQPVTTILSTFPLPDSKPAQEENATALFARFKTASGGIQWDEIRSLQDRGTLSAGGLSGEIHSTQDLLTGRSASRHKLGSISGAGGYDGRAAWQRGPGGEVAVLDAPEAKRRARSQAWLDARAYWYPQRIPATYEAIETRQLDGCTYHIIEAIPTDGDPIALWFAADTDLLARIVRRRGADIATTVLDDYRDVDGVRLAFRSVTDRADATGSIDPRQRMQIVLDEITTNVTVTDADFAVPAMAASARIDDASGVTRIPFDLVNNHIYVDGEVDGKSVRFMVDTGGMTLLTPAAARRLGLTGEGKLVASGPGEQRVDVALAQARQVRVGAATLDTPTFYVIDLGELPAAEGVAFDGLVGYEMFRHFGVQINYADTQLVLTEPAKFVAPTDATEIEFDFDRLTPIVSGILDGVPVRLTIDTGSRVSLTLSSPFVRAHDLVAKYNAACESVLGWGVGGAARMRAVRFGRLQLGELVITNIAGDLFTGTKGALTNPDQAGNLGGGVLKHFTVTFNYVTKRIYLAPNAAFGKPDVFDRSGLWLLLDGETLRVVDVAKGSAAERADIHENDHVIAIGDEGVATRTLSEWRQRLRELPVGTDLAIRLLRAGKTIDAQLVLADRIPSKWNAVPG
jgi:predicted aspartyl protease